MANKIKYGLKNVHYAVAHIATTNGTATYDTPVSWPGAVSLSLDASGEINKFFADNIAYAQFAANGGYEGDFESAVIPESFRKDVLGEGEDGNGVLYETSDASTTPFALLFQFEGDNSGTRYVLYNCAASRPSIEGDTTEDSIEVKTETVSLTASAIHSVALDKDIVKARCVDTTATSSTYASWFTTVYQPTA